MISPKEILDPPTRPTTPSPTPQTPKPTTPTPWSSTPSKSLSLPQKNANDVSKRSSASAAENLVTLVPLAPPFPRRVTRRCKGLATRSYQSWRKLMMMRRRRWYKRYRSNPWLFRQEEFPNANPSFHIVRKCICKVFTHYANPSSTCRPLAHDESR